jgi:Predicted pPIWI-associating nuclease
MNDVLTTLDQISEDVTRLASAVDGSRGRLVPLSVVQPIARAIARAYFESVRPELEAAQNRSGLVDEIDFVLQGILQLATAPREKEAYTGQIVELRPYLLEATIDLMKARGSGRLVLSQIERAIIETLGRMLPSSSASYEQALRDITQGGRVSWRGTAGELREVLREVIDHLAPDDKVLASPGFQLEQGQHTPTQKQKVRFILRARRSSSAAVTVAEASLETVDEAVASLARSTYRRGSVSAHTPSNATEIRSLKRYVDALLAELLEIS